MRVSISSLFLILLLFLPVGTLSADFGQGPFSSFSPGLYDFPENYQIRRLYSELFQEGSHTLRMVPSKVFEQKDSDFRVKFTTEEQNGCIYLLFLNEKDLAFPLFSKGSYIFKKDEEKGDFVQVKIFIRSEKDSFVRIFPDGDRVYLDLYVEGYPLYRDVLIPLRFSDVLTAPFSKIIERTGQIINWNLIFPREDAFDYSPMSGMVETIRDRLPTLRDHDDGAMDREGRIVSIENLQPQNPGGFNCSGFAKWIMDGLYGPECGRYMDIESLKKKTREIRGNRWSEPYEETRDPYFGLDWTRNLAVTWYRDVRGIKDAGPEYADVKNIPFFEYVDNMGYPIKDLKIILYLLAVTDPGHLYLGSVNGEYGKDPALLQHYHVAVFFPYFSDGGVFSPVVFERNVETGIDNFIKRYPDGYVHLVRVPAEKDFEPPHVEY